MNRATKTIVSTIGVILAIAGLDHGIFEILQGNTPTLGLLIQAIGPEHKMWHYGTEEAFTLLPTFLLTGLTVVALSLALIVWSVCFVHKKHGATVLGLLFIGLFLFGGGIAAQVLFAPFVWAAATCIHKPLAWWRKVLPAGIQPALAKLWLFTLALGSLSFLIGLFIAITGYVPGQNDPEVIINLCWAFIFVGGLGLYLLTFVAGFSCDIGRNPSG
ncbi:MAG: hypothetical protein JXA21_09970 [Anaerolineae bacterium]|nr:hypothetical protein [Anaerolineae bacterium]